MSNNISSTSLSSPFFQSVIMLLFREEKSPEDEIKAWQFWHSRQHSVKQRILDAGKYRQAPATKWQGAVLGRRVGGIIAAA